MAIIMCFILFPSQKENAPRFYSEGAKATAKNYAVKPRFFKAVMIELVAATNSAVVGPAVNAVIAPG
jgi:hypothetical protein